MGMGVGEGVGTGVGAGVAGGGGLGTPMLNEELAMAACPAPCIRQEQSSPLQHGLRPDCKPF